MELGESFKEISVFRKLHNLSHLKNSNLSKLYDSPRAITHLKKQNLLEIVNLLDKDVQEYYNNLKTERGDDTDPDIDRYFSEGEDD